jgi:hypothetical protein
MFLLQKLALVTTNPQMREVVILPYKLSGGSDWSRFQLQEINVAFVTLFVRMPNAHSNPQVIIFLAEVA